MENRTCKAYRDASGCLRWSWPDISLAFSVGLVYVVGILNLTPDSFSDGGSYDTVAAALARVQTMMKEGAQVVDVGGQSSRPGFAAISEQEEERRILPVLTALKELQESGKPRILVSLDTDKPALAERVLGQGLADILNDVSGGDRAMAEVAAACQTPLILMHRPATDDRGSLAAVMEDLACMKENYREAGLPEAYMALDPGIGFNKTAEEDLALLQHCHSVGELGNPLYIGASRKRFIGRATDNPDAARRLGGSLAAALWAAEAGAAFLRVHDVKETVEALAMQAALKGKNDAQ
ncbi:MAG: dihydropteroate synthase [Clostridiales bacterium]|nr:dihydropteroate synthase [Clostridiales bacterium]